MHQLSDWKIRKGKGSRQKCEDETGEEKHTRGNEGLGVGKRIGWFRPRFARPVIIRRCTNMRGNKCTPSTSYLSPRMLLLSHCQAE